MADSKSGNDHQLNQSAHVQPYYLAAHGSPHTEIPSFEELGLEELASIAKACSKTRERMELSGLRQGVGVPKSEDPWREIAGLWGSLGESLSISVAASVEIEMLSRAIENGDLPATMLVTQRFFSESLAQKSIEIGHRVTNLVARSVALRPESHDQVPLDMHSFKPFDHQSCDPSTWLSLTKRNAKGIKKAAAKVGDPSVHQMAEELRLLEQSNEWRTLQEQRGQDHHRFRLESSFLSGVDAGSGYTTDIEHPTTGEMIGHAFSSTPNRYKAGDGVECLVRETAFSAMSRVSLRVKGINDAFLTAVKVLSHGRYEWNGESFTTHL